jgi:hypothetical protein
MTTRFDLGFGPLMRASAVLLLFGLTLAACSPAAPPSHSGVVVARPVGSNPKSPAASTLVETGTPAATALLLTVSDAANCPVTQPGAAPADIADRLFGSASAFGNSDLWVGGLGEDGVILADSRFVESDGSIGWKFGWWRIASGTLAITGRRLDAQGPPPRALVPDGYGPRGFQASGVYFPTEGCWEVTGTVAGSELTFVTFVLRT